MQDSGGENDPLSPFGCDDGEADDEQSDWHESAPPGTFSKSKIDQFLV